MVPQSSNYLTLFFQIQSVMIIAWTSAHHLFAVKKFFKTDKYIIVSQSTFYAHFMLCQNDAVLDRIFDS